MKFFKSNNKSKPLPVVATPYHLALRKSQKKYGVTLFIALILIGYYAYAHSQNRAFKSEPVAVLLATENLPVGTVVESSQVVLKMVPRELVPIVSLNEVEKLVGQTVVQTVGQNEILVQSDLASLPHPDSITTFFNDGSAFVMGEDWFLSKLPPLGPGDFVDVLVANPKSGNDLTMVAATGLEVIQVDRVGGRKNLVVNVTPAQAESLLASRGLRLPMQLLIHNRITVPNPVEHGLNH